METSIIVAIIAGFVSFIGLVITKEQKISEFRQAWIESLRNDIAELMSAINHFELAYLTHKKQNQGKWSPNFIGEYVEITNKIQLLIHRINLRLNPKDCEDLIEELTKLSNILTSPSEMIEEQVLENATKNFTEKAHQIIKNEWEKVKKGEPWFTFTKWGIIILFIGLIAFYGNNKFLNDENNINQVKLNLEMTITDKKDIYIKESDIDDK
ncbi:hypothetical protein [Aliarcobacter cryaerophilus]|uniref:hypothetical protein n=1 Tax=Aliarcobacter cryaerophilus TaxID=28198 RepID=UPI0021B5441C|nr:hypothetical protein [Aliarcobacter cryaerophilus]MCT7541246.1 hypothetical protein [Aliarcobacter cryaerophilus]